MINRLVIILLLITTCCETHKSEAIKLVPREVEPIGFVEKLSSVALEQTTKQVSYDGAYTKISYPNGEVPENIGVCTDVVIRAYRKFGIDLQVDVHKDMKIAFDKYPNKWGLSSTDTNIDHRRVPNLEVFFKRKGIELPITNSASDYQPGDIVTWRIWGLTPHIGIVVNKLSEDKQRFLIVHNIGQGPKLEDTLFDFHISGHFRYYGSLPDSKE